MSDRKKDISGILCVDKPAGPTSHDLVQWVRRTLGIRAVGHCGTLDPPATGLLVVCVGTATKLVPFLTASRKSYQARFRLGESSSTGDAEGEILERIEVSHETASKSPQVLSEMKGSLMLEPPAVSAIRIDGKRAHELVREGKTPKLEAREMELVQVENLRCGSDSEGRPWVEATLCVSKGSYIRSLAVELGKRLGVPCLMAQLRRTACGSLSVDDPMAVTKFSVSRVQLPEALQKKRGPKWRIMWEPQDDEADNPDEPDVRNLLHALLKPAAGDHLPFPVVCLKSRPSRQDFARLSNGMKINCHWSSPLKELPSNPKKRPLTSVSRTELGVYDKASRTMVICTTIEGSGLLELSPKRVIRAVGADDAFIQGPINVVDNHLFGPDSPHKH